jgi:hypothetical protein
MLGYRGPIQGKANFMPNVRDGNLGTGCFTYVYRHARHLILRNFIMLINDLFKLGSNSALLLFTFIFSKASQSLGRRRLCALRPVLRLEKNRAYV